METGSARSGCEYSTKNNLGMGFWFSSEDTWKSKANSMTYIGKWIFKRARVNLEWAFGLVVKTLGRVKANSMTLIGKRIFQDGTKVPGDSS